MYIFITLQLALYTFLIITYLLFMQKFKNTGKSNKHGVSSTVYICEYCMKYEC